MIWSSLLAAQGLCSKPSLNNSCWLNSLQGLLPDTFRKYGHLTTLSHFLSLSSFLPPPCPHLIFFLFSISLFFSFFFLSLVFFFFFFFCCCLFLNMCQLFVSYLQVLASISALAPLSTALSIWRLLQPSHITSSGVCFQLWKAVSTTPSSHPPTAASLPIFSFSLSPPSALTAPFEGQEARRRNPTKHDNLLDDDTRGSQPLPHSGGSDNFCWTAQV